MLVIAADYLHMMNIYDTLDKDRSKDTVFLLLDYIGTDMQRVDELMEIALSDDARMAFRGSWVLAHLADSGVVSRCTTLRIPGPKSYIPLSLIT